MAGELTIWIEPGLAEHWMPQPGDGYSVSKDGETYRGVVRGSRPGDGGLWLELDIQGRYADLESSQCGRVR